MHFAYAKLDGSDMLFSQDRRGVDASWLMVTTPMRQLQISQPHAAAALHEEKCLNYGLGKGHKLVEKIGLDWSDTIRMDV